MITEAIEEAYGNQEEWDRRGLWVTDLGGCVRKIGYHWAGHPRKPKTAEGELRRQDGAGWEAQLRDIFTRVGWQFSEQQRVQLGPVTGKTDFLVTHPDLGKIVVEAKTISPFLASACEEGPLPDHRLQTLAYMQALGVEWGIVIYKILGMGSGNVREYTLWLHDPDAQRDLEAAVATLGATDFGKPEARQVPAHPYTKPQKQCRYCDYAEECWADYQAEASEIPEPERQSAALAYIEAWRREKKADQELKLAREVLEEKLRLDQDDEIPCPDGSGVRRRKSRDSVVVAVEIDEAAAERLLPPDLFAEAAELVVKPEAVKGLHDNGLIDDQAFAAIYVEQQTVKPGSFRLTVVE